MNLKKLLRFLVKVLVIIAVASIILMLMIWPIPVPKATVECEPSVPALIFFGFSVMYMYHFLPTILARRFEKGRL